MEEIKKDAEVLVNTEEPETNAPEAEITETEFPEAYEKKPAKKAKSKKAGKKSTLHKLLGVIIALILIIAAAVIWMAVDTKYSDSAVGNWEIKEVAVGEETMTLKEAEDMGLTEIGHFKLNNSGSCEIKILDFEAEGKWTQDENGVITINCGDEETFSATIDEEGLMTAEDTTSTKYTLEK
ncbi:MAG: hypothetical protein E7230_05945 [Clostridiales bacterium]|nr:hypothetical protein [Clostridiales bacterium]